MTSPSDVSSGADADEPGTAAGEVLWALAVPQQAWIVTTSASAAAADSGRLCVTIFIPRFILSYYYTFISFKRNPA